MSTVAEQLVDILRQSGVTRVYGVVGDSLNPFEMPGPVLVGVPVDYRDNHRLMEIVHLGVLN